MADRPSIRCIVQEMTDDQAVIIMVDSTLHREEILPSEKDFAYRMKLDAMKRQGLRTDFTSSPVATKFDAATELGKEYGESRDQVFRYIRLTYLIPEILEMVDNSVLKEKDKLQIALRPTGSRVAGDVAQAVVGILEIKAGGQVRVAQLRYLRRGLGGGDIAVGVAPGIDAGGGGFQPQQVIVAVADVCAAFGYAVRECGANGHPGQGAVCAAVAVGGGIARRAAAAGELPALGNQTVTGVEPLAYQLDHCAAVVALIAVDQPAQGVVIVVAGTRGVSAGFRQTVELAVAGVGVGNFQAVGIFRCFDPVQFVVGKIDAGAVAVGLPGQERAGIIIDVRGQFPCAHMELGHVAKGYVQYCSN